MNRTKGQPLHVRSGNDGNYCESSRQIRILAYFTLFKKRFAVPVSVSITSYKFTVNG